MKLDICYELNCIHIPPTRKLYIEALSSVMVFGDGALGSEFGLDEVYKGIIYDGISAFVGMQTELSLSLPYEDIAKRHSIS